MTAITRSFLVCDSCGEPSTYDTVPPATTVTQARQDAKQDGWARRGWRDLCGNCATDNRDHDTA